MESKFERDENLEQLLLSAVLAEERERPRTLQRAIGPSELGGCRELMRAKIFESPEEDVPEEHWPVAAHIGTVMGNELEGIFGRRLGADVQRRITTHLEEIGITIAGSSDVLFAGDGILVDLKGAADMGSVLYEGPKLAYWIQVAVYTYGAVQEGLLEEGAEARIVYYDRSGNYQGFVAFVVTWEQILQYVELAQHRLREVLAAQEALEAGDPVPAHQLRDFTPSFCFSTKVECPRRFACWGGSDWAPIEVLTDAATLSSARRYIAGREMERDGKAMRLNAREELQNVNGTHEGGVIISWSQKGVISVVEAKQPQAVEA